LNLLGWKTILFGSIVSLFAWISNLVDSSPNHFALSIRLQYRKYIFIGGFFIPEQIQRAIFLIHHFSLYLKHNFLHRKSIKPNLNAIENKIIPPLIFQHILRECTNPEF